MNESTGTRSSELAHLTSPEIEALLAISEKLGASRELSETFQQIMEYLATRFGMERGTLTLLEADTKDLIIRVAHGLSEEEMKRGKYKIGEGITGKVVETGGPVIVPSIGREPLFLDRTGARRNIDRDNIAFLCVPLKLENEVIGVLSVDKVRSVDDTLESDLRLLTIIASIIAQAVRVHGAIAEIVALKERTDRILAGMPDGVLVLGPAGLVVTLNRAAERIFGLARADASDRHFLDVFAPHAGVRNIIEQIYDDPNASSTYETKIFCTGAESVPVAITWSLIADESDSGPTIILNIQDLTEVKRIERQLRRSQRLAALGTMAAGVAHEIRNPLGGIRGASQLLAREMKDNPRLHEFTEVIVQEVDRLDRTVEQLLGFARPTKSDMAPIHIEDVIERALVMVKPEIEKKRIHVEKDFPQGLRRIRASQSQMTQLFLNLFLNALQAMPEAGTLSITIREESHAGGAEKTALIVTVTDTGHGMSRQTLEHLFMPFYTNRDSGTGLGLAIAHKIIEEHGGTIDAASKEGKGTTFTMSFPEIE
jgi:PAS domain S-box-containing protein